MSTERDIAGAVRSWLTTELDTSADELLDRALDRIATTPQRRASGWTWGGLTDRPFILRFGVAAAVVSVAVIIGYALITGPASVGPQPVVPATATPVPMPEAFDVETITLSHDQVGTRLEFELPADDPLHAEAAFAWIFEVSNGVTGRHEGTWGLLFADVTDAANHNARFSRVPLRHDDAAGFLAELAAIEGFAVGEPREAQVAGRRAVVAEVHRAGLAEPVPSGESGYPHLDVGGEGGIYFDRPSRVYAVVVDERTILIQVWATTAEGLEVHRPLENRIVGSIRALEARD